LGERRDWPALVIRSGRVAPELDDLVAAVLDGFSPLAIEDLTPLPLPPGGLWDPTFPPPPEPPPSPLRWRAFFTTAGDRDAADAALRSAFPELTTAIQDVPDEDWAARSQRALTAITAGAFIVAPPWDVPASPPRGVSVIVIEPSRGFGTGHHASTRLCLRALSSTDLGGRRVLDLGTGSGVLAMAAAIKGAATVIALDIDADAIDSARESQRLNPGASCVTWLIGDFRDPDWKELAGGRWDVVLANLTGGMLQSSAARIRDLIAAGGCLIASGFDEGEGPAVREALGLTARATFVEDGWVGLVAVRP
jgi:ribosomal protein L11 methyltransferase